VKNVTHQLVTRGGTVIDGTGGAARAGDIAVDAGRITTVGVVAAAGVEEIDATGCIVSPGWVDVHTHYDGQATWDPLLSPSCWHGATTAVMGNCGVGFAPVEPASRDWLIQLWRAWRTFRVPRNRVRPHCPSAAPNVTRIRQTISTGLLKQFSRPRQMISMALLRAKG
jgi:N-acyl-D-aspartate/D-glutamate deacylase